MAKNMALINEPEGWHVPLYTRQRIYILDSMQYTRLIEKHTAWNGGRAYQLLSLPVKAHERRDSVEHRSAHELVHICLERAFCIKLDHDFTSSWRGPTLGVLHDQVLHFWDI